MYLLILKKRLDSHDISLYFRIASNECGQLPFLYFLFFYLFFV